MRYFVELSYIGTPFKGWQIHPNTVSVQGVIEQALSKILKEKIKIIGSSRTDAGVHAQQQFIHFDSPQKITNFQLLRYNLNGILPNEIAIKAIFEVNSDAHTRLDAISRQYCYRIIKNKNPFLGPTSYIYHQDLDISLMNITCDILLKYDDFQCFSKAKTDVSTYFCKIEYAFWIQEKEALLFHIKANRFLRGMVRAIVGTMIEVGLKKLDSATFEQIIISKNRRNAPDSFPAQGLTLIEVGYPEDYFDKISIKHQLLE